MVEAPPPDAAKAGSGWEHLPLVVVWGSAASSLVFAPWPGVWAGRPPTAAVLGGLIALAMATAGVYRFRLWSPPVFLLATGVAFGLLAAFQLALELAFGHFPALLTTMFVAPAASGGAAGHLCGQWMWALLRACGFRGTGFIPKLVGAIGGAVLGLVAIAAAHSHFIAGNDMGGFETLALVWRMTVPWAPALGVVVVLGHLDRIRRERQTRGE